MIKLIKWIAIGGGVVALGGFLLFGTQAGSYIGTAAYSIREGISEQIPIEFELKRAENLIGEIEPQIDEAKRDLAQAEVDLQRVEEDVERLTREVEVGEQKLKHVSAAVGAESASYRLAGYDRIRVESDLARTFENYKNNVALLKGKRALIERQQQAVAAARTHLDAVRSEKARLEDMVAALRTQKRQLDALAASSTKFELDDTALGAAKTVLEDVKNRLDVAQRMLEDDIYFQGEGTAVEENRNIVAEIDEYFAGTADETRMVEVGGPR